MATPGQQAMLTFRDISWALAVGLALPCSLDSSGMLSATAVDDDGAQAGDAEDTSVPTRDAMTNRKDASTRDTSSPKPADDDDDAKCDQAVRLVIRDFTEAHPDFEKTGSAEQGLVEDELGDDHKPVFKSSGRTLSVSGPASFAQWYIDVDGVNERLSYELKFVEQTPGLFVFDSTEFFPIDNMGFGDGPRASTSH